MTHKELTDRVLCSLEMMCDIYWQPTCCTFTNALLRVVLRGAV